MLRSLLTTLALALGFAAAYQATAQTEAPAEAQAAPVDLAPAMRAAQQWLETVDHGRYGDSWEGAAVVFREAVPKVRWEASVQGIRDSLGPVMARKVQAANYARDLPGAPAGEYVVIQFRTHFDKKPLAVETVTPMKEKDGSWKVSGYFIR